MRKPIAGSGKWRLAGLLLLSVGCSISGKLIAQIEPGIGWKSVFDPLSVFVEHPQINAYDIYKWASSDDQTTHVSTVECDRSAYTLTRLYHDGKWDRRFREIEIYDSTWTILEEQRYNLNGNAIRHTRYTYDEVGRLVKKTESRSQSKKGQALDELSLYLQVRYYYAGDRAEELPIEWQIEEHKAGTETLKWQRGDARYNAQGQLVEFEISTKDTSNQTYQLAVLYKWEYEEKFVVQTLDNVLDEKSSPITSRRWLDADGRVIRQEHSINQYLHKLAYEHDANGLLVKSVSTASQEGVQLLEMEMIYEYRK